MEGLIRLWYTYGTINTVILITGVAAIALLIIDLLESNPHPTCKGCGKTKCPFKEYGKGCVDYE